eukprot:5804760-Pyramimonas_sp.AAC.2
MPDDAASTLPPVIQLWRWSSDIGSRWVGSSRTVVWRYQRGHPTLSGRQAEVLSPKGREGTALHRVCEHAVRHDNVLDSACVTQVAVRVLGVCSRVQDEIITRPTST